jgi:hypothetical protein
MGFKRNLRKKCTVTFTNVNFQNGYRKPVGYMAALQHPYRVSFVQKELCYLDSSLQKKVKIKVK